MNRIVAVLILALLSSVSFARGIPTPEMAMKFDLQQDAREWVSAFSDGNQGGFVMEFVPKGQQITAWSEMAAQQITFTPIPLRKFVDNWHAGLLAAEPAAHYSETADKTGAITVRYRAEKAKEIGIRRFIQGPDGIYMIAYHVRPARLNKTIYKTWEQIVAGAELIPNPEKR